MSPTPDWPSTCEEARRRLPDDAPLTETLRGLAETGVRTERKAANLAYNLLEPHANRKQRAHVVGFLMGTPDIEMHFEDVLDFIDEHNSWANYKPRHTRYYALLAAEAADKVPPELYEDVEDRGWLESEASHADARGTNATARGDSTNGGTSNDGWHTLNWNGCPHGFEACEGAEACQDQDPPDAEVKAHYRRVGGNDDTWFVLDLELPKADREEAEDGVHASREAAWEAAQKLADVSDWDHLKFSGNKGFHLVQVLDGRRDSDELEDRARDLADEANVDWQLVDGDVLKPTQVVRLLGSYHPDSGLYATEVDPSMTLDEILDRAEDPPDKLGFT